MRTLFENNMDMEQPDMFTAGDVDNYSNRPTVVNWHDLNAEEYGKGDLNSYYQDRMLYTFHVQVDNGEEGKLLFYFHYTPAEVDFISTVISFYIPSYRGAKYLLYKTNIDKYNIKQFKNTIKDHIGDNAYVNLPPELLDDIMRVLDKYIPNDGIQSIAASRGNTK